MDLSNTAGLGRSHVLKGKKSGKLSINKSGKTRKFWKLGSSKRRRVEVRLGDNWILKSREDAFEKPNKSKNEFKISKQQQVKNLFTRKQAKVVKTAKGVMPEYSEKMFDMNEVREFIDSQVIGEGSFGKVVTAAAKNVDKGKNISHIFVKKTIKPMDRMDSKAEAQREDSKNKLIGVPSRLYNAESVVTRYGGESLDKLLSLDRQNIGQSYQSKRMPVETKIDLSWQLLNQIKDLHAKGYIHQDIKPQNILVDAKGKLSLIDFAGMADVSKSKDPDKARVRLGMSSRTLAPPEYNKKNILINNRYDSWCAGLVIYELFTGKQLLDGSAPANGWNVQKDYVMQQNLVDVDYNNNIPDAVKDLIHALLDPDPDYRISATDALKLNAFKSKKPSLVSLTVEHERIFKELAALEDKLDKSSNISRKQRDELTAKIEQKRNLIKDLQKEINKFNRE